MKKPASILLFAFASAGTLPAAVTITANIVVPNGPASGGNGTAGNSVLEILSIPGTITASTSGVAPNNVVTLPVTTYSVSGIDLTSVGGSASESYTFTVGYTATTDGSTPASPVYAAFGNVGSGDGQVSGAETLTATVTLVTSSFSNLSLSGFTLARAGGVTGAETGTFSWTGGSHGITSGAGTVTTAVTGNSFTLSAGASSSINLEGFRVQVVAVPEPASASLLALGAVALLRRRRTA